MESHIDSELSRRSVESFGLKDQTRTDALELLGKVGIRLIADRRIIGMELYTGLDVHAYYRSYTDPDRIFHAQAYPGLGSGEGIVLSIQEMDYLRLIDLRAQSLRTGQPFIGNEHEADVREVFPQQSIPVYPAHLINILTRELTA